MKGSLFYLPLSFFVYFLGTDLMISRPFSLFSTLSTALSRTSQSISIVIFPLGTFFIGELSFSSDFSSTEFAFDLAIKSDISKLMLSILS